MKKKNNKGNKGHMNNDEFIISKYIERMKNDFKNMIDEMSNEEFLEFTIIVTSLVDELADFEDFEEIDEEEFFEE